MGLAKVLREIVTSPKGIGHEYVKRRFKEYPKEVKQGWTIY